MNHLWQRFLLASSLLVGLAIGIAATVFGYSNLQTVDVHWSVLSLNGVPLWAVVIVPIALILIAGTVFHWIDGLHHFTEHMRHRHRVHELEGEVARLRAHLDQVLEMPRQDASELAAKKEDKAALPAADVAEIDKEMDAVDSEAKPPEPEVKVSSPKPRRPRLVLEPKPVESTAEHTNGADSDPAAPAAEA